MLQIDLLDLGDVIPQRIFHFLGVNLIDGIKDTVQGLSLKTKKTRKSHKEEITYHHYPPTYCQDERHNRVHNQN